MEGHKKLKIVKKEVHHTGKTWPRFLKSKGQRSNLWPTNCWNGKCAIYFGGETDKLQIWYRDGVRSMTRINGMRDDVSNDALYERVKIVRSKIVGSPHSSWPGNNIRAKYIVKFRHRN